MGMLDFGPGGSVQEEDLKPCPDRGCDELVAKDARGCKKHKNQLAAGDAARRRAHPRNRVYRDPRWRHARYVVFARDNWRCADCGHRDLTGRTLVCDHVNEGGVMECPDPFDSRYLATRCRVCSGRKDGRRGGQRSA